jgi:hypothetical protein
MSVTVETMRALTSVLAALVGAFVGTAIGVALTYALLSGEGVNALVWVATGVFFCVPGMLGGAVAAGLLCRRLFPAVFLRSPQEVTRPGRHGFGASVVYGVGASVAVVVLGPLTAAYFVTGDSSAPTAAAGPLCTKPGIRYVAKTDEAVSVCFTLTPDRSRWVEIGWEFGRASGCPYDHRYPPPPSFGGSSYDDGDTLTAPGRIVMPGFTASIRGARVSGVLEDSAICAGKTFRWNARRAP